ncbi:hypothetical protein RAC89_18215 [Paenibacillus sp. GD4]|jgi:hypothetical protein|uniref:hypothetical protein n=1 Tax=Paenibacillus TaxID=44249 RepID=UPI0025436C77|nr:MULTISPECIES: hypothetical protein [Paenibacillus]MDQ1912327.1 hypothetical protein [Paenibacillus sp. GD4]
MDDIKDNANFGIPEGEPGVAATDGISDVVGAVINNLKKEATGEKDPVRVERKAP